MHTIIYIYIYIYIYIHIILGVNKHTYIYIYICMYVCIYIYIYMYTHNIFATIVALAALAVQALAWLSTRANNLQQYCGLTKVCPSCNPT